MEVDPTDEGRILYLPPEVIRVFAIMARHQTAYLVATFLFGLVVLFFTVVIALLVIMELMD